MRLRILSAASRDLLRGKRFYERRAEGLGDYFLDSLFSDIDSLILSFTPGYTESSEGIFAFWLSDSRMLFIIALKLRKFTFTEFLTVERILRKPRKPYRPANQAWEVTINNCPVNRTSASRSPEK
jgi:hypothetical protein